MKFAGFVCGLFMIAGLAAAQSTPERLRISGLQDSVEILKDRWGISHIYAKNEADLFFAQGLNWYYPHGAEIIQSFVNGINARIAETRRNPTLLPNPKCLESRPATGPRRS